MCCGPSPSLITAAIFCFIGLVCVAAAGYLPILTVTSDLSSEVSFKVDLWSGDVTCANPPSADAGVAAIAVDAICTAIKNAQISVTADGADCGYASLFTGIQIGVIGAGIAAGIAFILACVAGCCAAETAATGVPCCGMAMSVIAAGFASQGVYHVSQLYSTKCFGFSLNDLEDASSALGGVTSFSTISEGGLALYVAAGSLIFGALIYVCGAVQFNSAASQRRQQQLAMGNGQMMYMQQGMLQGQQQPSVVVVTTTGQVQGGGYTAPQQMAYNNNNGQQQQSTGYPAQQQQPTGYAPQQQGQEYYAQQPQQQQQIQQPAQMQQQPAAFPPPQQQCAVSAPAPEGYPPMQQEQQPQQNA